MVHQTASRPLFAPSECDGIDVKSINDHGDDVMNVFEV